MTQQSKLKNGLSSQARTTPKIESGCAPGSSVEIIFSKGFMVDMKEILVKQREFFQSGLTRSMTFRKKQLHHLKQSIVKNESRIFEALAKDLGKSPYESYLTECGILLEEIKFCLKNVENWSKPKKVPTPLVHFPASSRIYPEPFGVSLIIAPWNYPFQLAISPLIGAIAAGNCAVLKPSEYSIHTSRLLAEIIHEEFDPDYITVVEGATEVSQALLNEKFDCIFFTGSVPVGKIVMGAAAKHLTPVILELGGKSPCLIDNQVDIRLAAKRIASGKFINAGQTCVAPDYLFVHRDIKEEFIDEFKKQLTRFFGENPRNHPDYPRIISKRHFERLVGFLDHGRIIVGGDSDLETRYISPTLIDQVSWDDLIMQEEIFGPILPLLEFDTISEVIQAVNARPKPLALYLFSKNKQVQKQVVEQISYGGGCINDTLIHLATPYLPFGGVGESGMGNYHGKAGFDAFSHDKSVLTSSFAIDNPFRYPPYKNKLKLVKKLLG